MGYSREFYALNLRFAHRVAQVSGMPFEQALLRYTNLYVRFGLGRELEASHPVWREYLSGLNQSEDDLEWTYHFALRREAQAFDEASLPTFGCFSYSMWNGHRVRLHFHNQEGAGVSPLSDGRREVRLAELKKMFAFIHQHERGAESLVGGSWLYHVEAYRRLFPPAFLATAKPGGEDYAYMTLWGQFLDRNGRVREEAAMRFNGCLDRQDTLEGVLACFPLTVLYLEASIEEYYRFYGIRQ